MNPLQPPSGFCYISVHSYESHEDDLDVQLQIASDIPLASSSGGEEIPVGPPPPKPYGTFLDKHYPHLKKKLLLVLSQLINSSDKDVISSALHTIMDRAPLVSYLVCAWWLG